MRWKIEARWAHSDSIIELLADGWEPFAVTECSKNGITGSLVWLKRQELTAPLVDFANFLKGDKPNEKV